MENLAVDRGFWAGKNVLITGHTGFKGSWLALWLQDMGATVSGYSLPAPTSPSIFERADVAAGMNSVLGDVRNYSDYEHAFRAADPDIIFHLAAQSLVRPSYDDPLETYSTNVMGTANVLEAVRQGGIKGSARTRSVVIVTSDKCYDNREWDRGYVEDDRLGGRDPYSNSKGCAELVANAFRQSYFADAAGKVGIATVRAGNVIGGGDWALDRLVPDAIKAFADGKAVQIRNPNAVRPWQHVLEPLAGYLRLCEKLHDDAPGYADAWNFGPDAESEKPVADIIRLLAENWGGDAHWVVDDGDHPHEATFLKLDSSRARARLDWAPRLELVQALDKTVSWYRHEQEQRQMRNYTIGQIREYENVTATG